MNRMITTYTAGIKGITAIAAKFGAICLPFVMLAQGKIDEKTYVPLLWLAGASVVLLSVGGFIKGTKDDRKLLEMKMAHEKEMRDEEIRQLRASVVEQRGLLAALKTASDEAKLHHQFICPMVATKLVETKEPTHKIEPDAN